MQSFKQYITEDAVTDQNEIWKNIKSEDKLPRSVQVRGKKISVSPLPPEISFPKTMLSGLATQRKRDLFGSLVRHPIRTLRTGFKQGILRFAKLATPHRRAQVITSDWGGFTPSLLSHELQHVADFLKPKNVEQKVKQNLNTLTQRASVPYPLQHLERSARRAEAVSRAHSDWTSMLNSLQSDRNAPHLQSREAFRKWVDTAAKTGARRETSDEQFNTRVGGESWPLPKTRTQRRMQNRLFRKLTPERLQRQAGRVGNEYYKAFYNRRDGLSVDDIHGIVTGGKWRMSPSGTPERA